MVSTKTIKSLDFQTIEDYFAYIVESEVNGQIKQAKTLFNELSTSQKDAFKEWFLSFYHYEAIDNDTTVEKEYLKLIKTLNN